MGTAAEKIEDVFQAKCPHCGSVTAPEVMNENDIHGPGNYLVCCNFKNGGCGACGPYERSERAAIVSWNRRA